MGEESWWFHFWQNQLAGLKRLEGIQLEDHVEYPKEVRKKNNKLTFLPKRMKIWKVEKLVANFEDKKMYVVDIKDLNKTLKHGLKLKKKYIELLDLNIAVLSSLLE